MKQSLLAFIFVFSFTTLFAQKGSLTGQIINQETKEPIAECHVFIPNTTFQAYSDSLGNFSLIGIPVGPWEILAFKNGFDYSSKDIQISQMTKVLQDWALQEKVVDAKEDFKISKYKKAKELVESRLGIDPKNPELVITNPEVLTFYEKEGSDDVWLDFSDVLMVQNLKTGYLISVRLRKSQNLSMPFEVSNLLLAFLEMDLGGVEENKLVNSNRISSYEESPTFAIRKLIGDRPEEFKLKTTDKEGEFILLASSPIEIREADQKYKVLSFAGEGIELRANGSPIYPELLKTQGFPNSEYPLKSLPLDFDYDRTQALNTIERTPQALTERVFLHTDKDIYLMGEELFFKAYMMYGDPLLMEESSKVLHVELLDSSGYSMDHRIFPIENGMAQGQIPLTPEYNTRDFMIKSYTLWGANYGNEFEFYKPFQVYTNFPENEIMDLQMLSEGVTIFADKEVYQDRDSVTINLIARNKSGAISGANLSVSVIGQQSFPFIESDNSLFVDFADSIPPFQNIQLENFQMQKELGFILKGKIKEDGALLEKSKVEVLVENFMNKRELIADEEGNFLLDGLHQTGDFSVLLKARNNFGKQFEEFEIGYLESPNRPDERKKIFPDLSVVNRPLERVDSLQKAYLALREGEILLEEVEVKSTRKIDSRSMPFGRAPMVLEMEDVYLTGNTEQFIYALANRTGLRAGGIPPMLINPRGYPGGPPVILLNGSPITSVLGPSIGANPKEDQYRALQSINVFTIERVEVMKSVVTLLGEAGRFGAVNIITKQGQHVGSKEKPYQEFKLQGLQRPIDISNPLYTFPSSTYYWNPEVKISSSQTSTSVTFKLPENPGAFWVLVNGVNASGEPVSGRFLINDKKIGST